MYSHVRCYDKNDMSRPKQGQVLCGTQIDSFIPWVSRNNLPELRRNLPRAIPSPGSECLAYLSSLHAARSQSVEGVGTDVALSNPQKDVIDVGV